MHVFSDPVLGGISFDLRRRWCEALLAPLVLTAVFALFAHDHLNSQVGYDWGPDTAHLLYPLFSYAANSFAGGEYPYWVPGMFGGHPFYNSPQFSPSYPLYFLSWVGKLTWYTAIHYAHVIALLHLWILQLNMYVLLRILKVRILPSLVGACLAAFNPAVYCYLVWPNIVAPYSWLPLALGGVFLVLQGERPRLGAALGAVATGLLVLASPSQPLIHLAWIAGTAILYWFVRRRRLRLPLRRPLSYLGLMAAGALVLAAPNLIVCYSFCRGALRWVYPGLPPIIGTHRVPWVAFTAKEATFTPAELARLVFPLDIHRNVGDIHLGVLAMFLAGLSLFALRRRKWVPLWWAIGLYALVSSTGVHLGLAYINYYVPLLNKIREPGRHLIVAHFCFCILAAYGLEYLGQWLNARSGRSWRKEILFVPAFAAVVSVIAATNRAPWVLGAGTVWLPIGLFAIAIVFLLFTRMPALVGKAMLAVIVLLPAFVYPWTPMPAAGGESFRPNSLRSWQVLGELARISDIHDYRVTFLDETFYQCWAMDGLHFGIRSTQGYFNPVGAKQFNEVGGYYLSPHRGRLFGMKYLLCKDGQPCLPGYERLRRFEGYTLYQDQGAMPRYFLAAQVAGVCPTTEDFLAKVERNDDYRSKVFVRPSDLPAIQQWLGAAPAVFRSQVMPLGNTNNSRELWCEVSDRSMLVLNEFATPAWKAWIDGRAATLYTVNGYQVGALLERGPHLVRFEYIPGKYWWLVQFRLVAVIAVLLAIAAGWWRRRAGRPLPAIPR